MWLPNTTATLALEDQYDTYRGIGIGYFSLVWLISTLLGFYIRMRDKSIPPTVHIIVGIGTACVFQVIQYCFSFRTLYEDIPSVVLYLLRFFPYIFCLFAYGIVLFLWLFVKQSLLKLKVLELSMTKVYIGFLLVLFIPTVGISIICWILNLGYIITNDIFFVYFGLLVIGLNFFFQWIGIRLIRSSPLLRTQIMVMIVGTAILSVFFVGFIISAVLFRIASTAVGFIVFEIAIHIAMGLACLLEVFMVLVVRVQKEISKSSSSLSKVSKLRSSFRASNR